MAIVTLLSDFGTVDGYVAAMKGVVLCLAPQVQLMDLTHDIPPQDIAAGAWALAAAQTTFPAGSIHVAVVDPGVGTARRGLLLRRDGQLFVGPDNGLLSWLRCGEGDEAWSLDVTEAHRADASATFHGRDVFASVAGHLAAGRPAGSLGSPYDGDLVTLPRRRFEVPEGAREVLGAVIHVDRFGNLISDLGVSADLARRSRCVFQGRDLGPLRETFGSVEVGQWLAYRGSSGTVEIAIRDGSAAGAGAARGDEVRLCIEAR